jgi:hypothetical protein
MHALFLAAAFGLPPVSDRVTASYLDSIQLSGGPRTKRSEAEARQFLLDRMIQPVRVGLVSGLDVARNEGGFKSGFGPSVGGWKDPTPLTAAGFWSPQELWPAPLHGPNGFGFPSQQQGGGRGSLRPEGRGRSLFDK